MPEPIPLFGEFRAFFGPITETQKRERVLPLTYKIFNGEDWHLIDSEKGQAVMRALTAQWVPVEAEHADLDRLAAPVLYEYGADAR